MGIADLPSDAHLAGDIAATDKAPAVKNNDNDVDLFGSDDDQQDAEATRIREERLADYRKKKEAKPKAAAKSIVILDVKPWGTLVISIVSEATH